MDQATMIKAFETVSGIADAKIAEADNLERGSQDWFTYYHQANALRSAAIAILHIKDND